MCEGVRLSQIEGKVALVTGAGGEHGIGRACALKLAELGADVVVTDLHLEVDGGESGWRGAASVEQEISAMGRRSMALACDLSRAEEIRTLVGTVVERLGRIDILVNNARALIGHDRAPITEFDEDVWREFLDVNLTAIFLLTKYVGRELVRRGEGGRIINIGSAAGKHGTPLRAAYVSTKFGLVGLTQTSALDLAGHGITVNSVCPGQTDSKRPDYWEVARAAEEDIPVERFRAQLLMAAAKQIPLGRVGTSQDIAALVGFLATDDGSFITGQSYNVNGGSVFC